MSLIHLRLSPALSTSLLSVCASIRVSDLLRELAREAVRLNEADPADTALYLVVQLIVLQARQPLAGPLLVPLGQDWRLRLATGLLRDNPGSALTLCELAARVHSSTHTLARLFVTETGMSYGRWREHLRMVCAVDRLARGWSITQTALELGYQGASRFTTRFTLRLGAPPRRYMQQLQALGTQAGDDVRRK